MKASRLIANRFKRIPNWRPFFVFLLLLAGPVLGDPLDQWTRRHPFPNWAGAAFGANRFVIVGEIGAIQSSSDGVVWTAQSSGTANALADVVFANGRFVAVGSSGTILTSTNGSNWTAAASGVSAALAAVTYGNGIYVAVGASGTVLTSGNGINWTNQSGGITPSLNLKSVAFGNNLYVAITGAGEIIVSPDGVTWTSQPSQGGTPYRVAYLNTNFVIVDYGMKFSADGTNWTAANYVYPVLVAMTYAGGYYVGAGTGGSIQYSANGTSWTAATTYNSTYDLSAITYGNGVFVAVGLHGLIRSSTDHLNWPISNQTLTYLATLYGVKYINNEFVVVGDFGIGPGGVGEYCPILFSGPPGGNWYRRASGSFNTFWDVAYGQGMYVIATASAGLRISTNGIDWSSVGSGLANQQAGLTYASNLFVLTGWNGGISTSPDGLTWTPRTSGTTRNLWGVTYGNGMYIAVGQSFSSSIGAYITSGDGLTWTNHSFSSNLRNIAYGAGTFVIVGDSGYIASSTTGLSWTARGSGTAGAIYGVCYGGGYFVAVGAAGYLATSPDGATWTVRNSGISTELERVAYGNGTFVVTGTGGTIIQSASIFPALLAAKRAGGMEVDLVGGMDRSYVLETTSNLTSAAWTPLTTLTSGQRQFTDPDTAAAGKFYRLTVP
jgi:hypothetical protein